MAKNMFLIGFWPFLAKSLTYVIFGTSTNPSGIHRKNPSEDTAEKCSLNDPHEAPKRPKEASGGFGEASGRLLEGSEASRRPFGASLGFREIRKKPILDQREND